MLGNGTISSEITMEHITSRYVIDGSAAGNGVLYVTRLASTPRNNKGTVGGRCSLWAPAEATSGYLEHSAN